MADVSQAGRGRAPARAQWPLRIAGCLFGVGACLVGLFSLLGADPSDPSRERAIGFAIAALVIGGVALVGSLATRDVHALWYCAPRRWRAFSGDVFAVREPTARRPTRSLTPADDASEDHRTARSRGRW